MIKLLVLAAVASVAVACGASERSPSVAPVPVPAFEADNARLVAGIDQQQLACGSIGDSALAFGSYGVVAPQGQALCSTNSDCAGFGNCSNSTCGHCSTNSDCNGHGTCSYGSCNHCSTNSECASATSSSGRCVCCSSNSDRARVTGRASNGRVRSLQHELGLRRRHLLEQHVRSLAARTRTARAARARTATAATPARKRTCDPVRRLGRTASTAPDQPSSKALRKIHWNTRIGSRRLSHTTIRCENMPTV